jgi:transcriptional regulator with XRE-family HTH domain
MSKQSIGDRVQALRNEKGMSSTTLAKKVGISQAQISRLESGAQGWRSITLQKTADALGVTVGFLYSDKGSVAGMAALLKQKPALKQILSSPMLSELAIKLAEIKRTKPAAYRAVKTIIDQLAD